MYSSLLYFCLIFLNPVLSLFFLIGIEREGIRTFLFFLAGGHLTSQFITYFLAMRLLFHFISIPSDQFLNIIVLFDDLFAGCARLHSSHFVPFIIW